MTPNPQAQTSAAMLGRLLSAVGDFGADDFETDGARVSCVVTVPSADAYRVTVEWLEPVSP